jgi:hypothetical protein
MELTILILPLASLAVIAYYMIPSVIGWYRLNHTEFGHRRQAIQAVGEKWKTIKEKQISENDDPLFKAHFERKAEERMKQHKEYNAELYKLEEPERKAAQEAADKIRALEREQEARNRRAELAAKEQAYYQLNAGNVPTPLEMNPTQRFTDTPVFLREDPSIHSRAMQAIPANTIVNCAGFINGVSVYNNDLWYVVKMGTKPSGQDYYYYLWSGSCTLKSEGALADFNEYEEDTYTLRSADGSICQSYTNRTRINKAYATINETSEQALNALIDLNTPRTTNTNTLNAQLITAERIYV